MIAAVLTVNTGQLPEIGGLVRIQALVMHTGVIIYKGGHYVKRKAISHVEQHIIHTTERTENVYGSNRKRNQNCTETNRSLL